MFKSDSVADAEFDLYVFDDDLNLEELPAGNALATTACATSIGCFSCPVGTLTTASTLGSAG